jgi:hypothetical protein
MSFTSGRWARHAQHTLCERDENVKRNTSIAYDPKGIEFANFCKEVYSSQDQAIIQTVTEEKVFSFLFYQSIRPKKTRGGGKRKVPGHFDRTQLLELMALDSHQILELKDVVGYDVLNQYMCAILHIWERQRDKKSGFRI